MLCFKLLSKEAQKNLTMKNIGFQTIQIHEPDAEDRLIFQRPLHRSRNLRIRPPNKQQILILNNRHKLKYVP